MENPSQDGSHAAANMLRKVRAARAGYCWFYGFEYCCFCLYNYAAMGYGEIEKTFIFYKGYGLRN